MPSPKQIVLVTGLLAGVGAVWVPQLLNEDEGPAKISENIPAMVGEPGEFEDGGPAAGSIGAPSPGGPGGSSFPGAPGGAPTSPGPASSPSSSPEVATTNLPAPTDGGAPGMASNDHGGGGDLRSRAGDLLASVSASLAAAEARRSAAPLPELTDPLGDFDPDAARSFEFEQRSVALEAEWGAVQDFLEASPVTAVMMGEGTAMALVGSRIVRPGDRLAGGLLEVRVIGRDGVRYRYREQDVLQELPAFQAVRSSSSVTSESDADSESSDSGPELPETTETASGEAQ